jgi:hypothetical protein
MNSSAHQYTRLAHELASWPDLVGRLLVDHPAGGVECSGCTIPGGRMAAIPPCSIRTFALAADAYARGHDDRSRSPGRAAADRRRIRARTPPGRREPAAGRRGAASGHGRIEHEDFELDPS